MSMGRKKEKITYIDDGRTIADMSGVGRAGIPSGRTPGRPHPSFREAWSTYWAATKMMLLPTLAIVGLLAVAYLIMALVFYFG